MSGVTNSLGVTTLETSFSSSPVISVILSVNVSNLSTRFGSFPGFLQPYSTGARGAKGADWDIMLTRPSSSDGKGAKDINRGACIEAAGIGSTCTRDTCARGTCAGNASSAVSACIKGAGPEGTGTEDAGTESACTGGAGAGGAGGVGAVKGLGIHSR